MNNPGYYATPVDPIGIFDSGVGGLSVLREITRQLPGENVIYVADQAHVPYGLRSPEEVREYSVGITEYLLSKRAKIIVLACNTASAAALKHLRQSFPHIPFVGMEPAVKPAVETTKSRVIGVLATPATFQGTLYNSLVERFGQGVTIHQHTCPGLVQQIERGELDSPTTRQILEEALFPMLSANVDTIVLGCTHYPFVLPLIRSIIGDKANIIDPAPAVARQTSRLLEHMGLLNASSTVGQVRFATSGNPAQLKSFLARLNLPNSSVYCLSWKGRKLADTPCT